MLKKRSRRGESWYVQDMRIKPIGERQRMLQLRKASPSVWKSNNIYGRLNEEACKREVLTSRAVKKVINDEESSFKFIQGQQFQKKRQRILIISTAITFKVFSKFKINDLWRWGQLKICDKNEIAHWHTMIFFEHNLLLRTRTWGIYIKSYNCDSFRNFHFLEKDKQKVKVKQVWI